MEFKELGPNIVLLLLKKLKMLNVPYGMLIMLVYNCETLNDD